MMMCRAVLVVLTVLAVGGYASGQQEATRSEGGEVRRARQPARSLASALSRPREELRAATAQCLAPEESARVDHIAALLRAGNRAAVQQEWPLLMRDIRARIAPDASAPPGAPDAAIMLAMQAMAKEALGEKQAFADVLRLLGEFEKQLRGQGADKLDQLLQARIRADQTSDLGWLAEVIRILLLLLWLLDMTLHAGA